MMKYQKLAVAFNAYKNCVKSHNVIWEEKWQDVIDSIIYTLPHGSGIDVETRLNHKKSSSKRIVLEASYHCMDENGYYGEWIDFSIILTPDWDGVNIRISGRFDSKNQHTKEYLSEIYYETFSEEYKEE